MANRPDLDDDDDFSEIYKAYTGPLGSSAANVQEKKVNNKRSQPSSDEEEERDPNAVPTDFTSREAKVWEAKSKATERNWKKRKEEEMICKICGDAGHFTQVGVDVLCFEALANILKQYIYYCNISFRSRIMFCSIFLYSKI